ncbi:MAG: UvrD-helicase domain-containing protein [Coprococcus sp.]
MQGAVLCLYQRRAGSGKTAVLVERLIRLLTDEKHPVDIERLLVVTFTNAAAAEMRERIGRGSDQKLLEEQDHTAWIRQKLLLPCAQISTIHSLCLKTIREHFEVLDLDPVSYRLGDEAELKLFEIRCGRGCDGDLLCIRKQGLQSFLWIAMPTARPTRVQK